MAKKDATTITITAESNETDCLKQLDRLFNFNLTPPKLVDSRGEEIPLPESVYQALGQVISAMAQGKAISLVPTDREMTTQEASDHLNVSRPYLIKLLEQGEIPYLMVGTHRRVRFQDLIAYKQQRDSKRRETLTELTEFLQDEKFGDE